MTTKMTIRMTMKILRIGVMALGLAVVTSGVALAGVQAKEKPACGIGRAVGLGLTERGQKYFVEHFADVLFANGISLSEGQIDSFVLNAEKPLKLDQLPIHFQKFSGTLGKIRSILKSWLLGFSFNDPLIRVEVKDIRYSAQIDRLGFSLQTSPVREFTGANSAVFVLEAQIPSLRLSAASVMGKNLNNSSLKTFGVRGLFTELSGESKPLEIQIPIGVRIKETGNVEFNILGIHTSLDQVDLKMGFDRPLVLPRVEVLIDGHPIALNQAALERELLKLKDRYLEMLQVLLDRFAEEQLPQKLNNLIQAYLPQNLVEGNEMAAPGAPVMGAAFQTKFKWWMSPQELRQESHMLFLGLAASVRDPAKSSVEALGTDWSCAEDSMRSMPTFSGAHPADYDLALSLNQDLVNQILGLSFARGYFEKVPYGDAGESLAMTVAPELVLTGALAKDRAILRLQVAKKPQGIEKFFVENPLLFSFDMNVRLVVTPGVKGASSRISLLVDRIDESTVKVKRESVKLGFLHSMIEKSVKKKIRRANVGYKSNPMALAKDVAIPSEVAGIPLSLQSLQSDSSGYIVLYLEYGGQKQ
ncbi:hypothetical protein WDW86_02365 [Bdellovibrionota bacterium FG-2]